VIFTEQAIPGVFLIEPQRIDDERGFFTRTYCIQGFAEQGIEFPIAQGSVAYNERRGTLRGMHLQAAPHEEAKLVRCTAGAIFDVALDLRPDSRTRHRWVGAELSAAARNELYLPHGVAHGYLTLEDACRVEYLISTAYHAAANRGVRWDDPAFGIDWPFEPVVISERDRSFPSVEPG
jgi:dTDP-4-dehydrorhamnose 3,5-epimerase